MSWLSEKISYEVDPPRSLPDDKQEFRVKEFEGKDLKRIFTVVVDGTQSVRGPVVVGHWCKMKKENLPPDGGSINADLDEFQKTRTRVGE
jgi:hypothetical protein